MTRSRTLCVVVLAGVLAGCASPPSSEPQDAAPRILERPSFSVRLPITRAEGPDGDAVPGALSVRPAAEDRQPEGPQSFDVLDDGGFLVADPLRDRLLEYAADGTFRRAVPIAMPASSVTVIGTAQVEVVSAATGAVQTFDEQGSPVGGPRSESAIAGGQGPDITLDSARSGVVTWPNAPNALAPPRPQLRVVLQDLSERIASLQVIESDEPDRVYVALEATDAAGRSLEDLRKIVRRYDESGRTDTEIRNIAVDYYVVPNTEFRVLRGVLYQLYPRETEVVINGWRLR